MKKITRLLALILAFALVACMFAGCGNKKGNKAGEGNTAKDIKISYWNAGYGSEWIEQMAKRFEKAYPEYKVKLNISASDTSIVSSFGMPDIDDTDIYIVSAPITSKLSHFEPLNDVFEITAKGDSVKVGDKFDEKYINNSTFSDGNVYVMPTVSSGAFAVVYNKKIFKDVGISVPRTTTELTVAADALYAEDIPAFVSYKGSGYWKFALPVWFAQYEGVDYYLNNFLGCKDPETGKSPSKEIFTRKDGRYEILKALQGFFTPDYVLTGSNSQSHTIMQTYFVQGKGAMMYNGGWLENEAKSAGKMDNFGVFRLPLISSITNKLSTVKNEMDLRELITAVDNVIDGKKDESEYKSGDDYVVKGKTVAAKDWEHIKSARQTTYGSQIESGFFVPNYSTAIKAAKEFIAYMYSDENAKAVAVNNHYAIGGIKKGIVDIDTSKWSPLAKEFYTLQTTYTTSVSDTSVNVHEIFTDGGASAYAGIDFIPHYFSNNPADRWTADKVWDDIVKNVNSKYTVTWLANIS